jgi:hypothetical protein
MRVYDTFVQLENLNISTSQPKDYNDTIRRPSTVIISMYNYMLTSLTT